MLGLAGPADARNYPGATTSSPISLSADGKYLWSVNPGGDTVSVIYDEDEQGDREDQRGGRAARASRSTRTTATRTSPTPHPGSVTVIRITSASARQVHAPRPTGAPGRRGQIVTGLGAVERGRVAERPARVRGEQRPGHDHRDRRDQAAPQARRDRARQPQEQRLQRPRPHAPLPAARPGGLEEQQAPAGHELLLVDAARAAQQAHRPGPGGRRLPPQRQQQARSGSAATARAPRSRSARR